MVKIFIISTTLILLACAQKATNVESRAPQSIDAQRDTIFFELSDSEKKRAEQRVIRKNSDLLSIQLKNFVKAQRLVSEFDQRSRKLVEENESDEVRSENYSQLLHSNLYCDIQEHYKIHQEHELRLLYTYYFAIQHSQESRQWLVSQLAAFSSQKEDLYKKSVSGQLVLFFKSYKSILCPPGCNESQFVSDLKLIGGENFHQKGFTELQAKMKESGNLPPGNSLSNLKPGNCFGDSQKRTPNSSGQYDWRGRSWTGTSLPPGHFVVTYDDGPHDVFTENIMKTWTDAGLEKPSFFWLTQNIRNYPDIVKNAFSKGYTIGSHSNVHADLGTIARSESGSQIGAVNKRLFPDAVSLTGPDFLRWSDNKLDSEILGAIRELSRIGQTVVPTYRTRFFRLPYGSGVKNSKIGSRLQAARVDHFFWEVDSLDWQDKNPASIVDRVLTQMMASGSGIILFHDVHQQSFEAAALLIEAVKNSKRPFKFVPLADLKIQPWPN